MNWIKSSSKYGFVENEIYKTDVSFWAGGTQNRTISKEKIKIKIDQK